MTNSLNVALAEVSQIIDILGNEYRNKLPYKFIKFMEENKEENVTTHITKENYENVNLTRDAIIIISLLNLNYWVTDQEEKERLIKIYQENDKKNQNLAVNYKDYSNYDWLSNSKVNKNFEEVKSNSQSEEKCEKKYLINIEKQSMFSKIVEKIKKIFKIN